MYYSLLCFLTFITSLTFASEEYLSTTLEETDDIYWETPQYLSRLEAKKTAEKVQYVYHLRTNNFTGDFILPLNVMPFIDGFSEIHKRAISKYQGRERFLTRIIPTLNCLWNDVIFFSPVHPHKHYEEYTRLGFTPIHLQFYKIPIDVLKDKRVTVWKWLSHRKYPPHDPIHEAIDSYCAIDFSHFQEMDDLPNDTKEVYLESFDPAHPEIYPQFNWYRIPHVLCQDPIDLLDDRITLINWEDSIEDSNDLYEGIKRKNEAHR